MHYRIDTLPYEVRAHAIDNIKNCFTLEISQQPTLFRKLHTLLKMLENPKDEANNHMDQFVQITKLYDKHRHQSIEKSLPKLYNHVKKYF